jgi:hypothetical protein
MTIYRLTITKKLTSGNDSGKGWSNVYHLNEASLAAAVLHAPTIVDLEKTIYPDNVQITRWSVHNPAVRGDGQSDSVAVVGTRTTGTPATQLPLFVAVLFKFTVTTGRPSLKYLRLPLDEGEISNGVVDSAVLDAISTGWAVPLVADGAITDESGNALTGYGFNHSAVSRQLGWHRRTRQGFHRGWVANP